MLEFLLNKVAGSHALLNRDSSTGVFHWNLWNFQEHPGGCFWKFKKWLCWTNVYLQLSKIHPRTILKKNFTFLLSRKEWCAERKMRWERGWQKKIIMYSSNLFLSLFCCYWYGKYTPNIFISNVLLKNPTERNAYWGTSLEILKNQAAARRCSGKFRKIL